MNEPTAEQLRELDNFCAEKVMDWLFVGELEGYLIWEKQDRSRVCVGNICRMLSNWHPTEQPAAAMGVLKKCVENIGTECLEIRKDSNGWWIALEHRAYAFETAPTLELAICKFAKDLFETK